MNQRIREVRSALGLTQNEFGSRLGVARNTVANYETGNRSPSNQIVISICREFNVNEDWLKDGQGEMFVETEGTYLSKLSRQYDLDELDQVILKSYLALTKGQRNGVKDFFKHIAKSLNNEEVAASIDIDEELESYRLELLAEQKGEILSVSEGTERKVN